MFVLSNNDTVMCHAEIVLSVRASQQPTKFEEGKKFKWLSHEHRNENPIKPLTRVEIE